MCVLAEVLGEWCDTAGQLRQALGRDPIRDACYSADPKDDHCLCGVDVPATLQAAGAEWIVDECGDFHVTSFLTN